MPTVQAWKRSKRGAFSTSARISAFLSGLSALDIELVYTPGQEMKSSDYNSRHPTTCNEKRCQICEFANEMECLGDNLIPMVAAVMVEDIEQGKITMPFTQRNAWLKVQNKDPLPHWFISTSRQEKNQRWQYQFKTPSQPLQKWRVEEGKRWFNYSVADRSGWSKTSNYFCAFVNVSWINTSPASYPEASIQVANAEISQPLFLLSRILKDSWWHLQQLCSLCIPEATTEWTSHRKYCTSGQFWSQFLSRCNQTTWTINFAVQRKVVSVYHDLFHT